MRVYVLSAGLHELLQQYAYAVSGIIWMTQLWAYRKRNHSSNTNKPHRYTFNVLFKPQTLRQMCCSAHTLGSYVGCCVRFLAQIHIQFARMAPNGACDTGSCALHSIADCRRPPITRPSGVKSARAHSAMVRSGYTCPAIYLPANLPVHMSHNSLVYPLLYNTTRTSNEVSQFIEWRMQSRTLLMAPSRTKS